MMNNEVIYELPRLLQIGSTGRNSGKTAIAKALICRFKKERPLVALKIITISGDRGVCQRGGTGCGICTSIDSGYELIEETNKLGKKDTMALLQAGCQQVFLLKVFTDYLETGFAAFLEKITADSLIICESNSLRTVIKPGLFVMIDNHRKNIKPTAAVIYEYADLILSGPEDRQLEQIGLSNQIEQGWVIKTTQEVF